MNEELPTRRVVLRGALAVGCGLFLPLLSPGQARAQAAATDAPKKMKQATVRYQAQPKGEQKCSGCTNFIAESKTCKLVEGQISPDGWCNMWAKKV
ncbi:high-potential iron-sulfur protein [Magnetospirillum moscoviense]|uniref:High-potential iron-sulfur protein n=1 Tax=Magnetospirillum moscoviense TaxID=1437059 RepID=A0A178MT10_9PROT|nr:high-potential iron-sulfur protein [Magnetospirillum moscoviense]MBF0324997.1 high-potential iron-sulfur protein [Alphaproteobacteria bacterium]OAN52782.1 hypothetical protein A6A05_10415 [Magnetospirillum moscoviense]